jgi:hypothetical protein
VAVGVGFDLTTAYSGVFAYSAGSRPVSMIGSAQPTAFGRHFVSAIELVDSAESLMCYGTRAPRGRSKSASCSPEHTDPQIWIDTVQPR